MNNAGTGSNSRAGSRFHLCLFGLAVLVRLIYLALFGGLDNVIHDSMSDQFVYLDLARNLATGSGLVVSRDTWVATAYVPTSIVAPVYPLWLAAVFRMAGDNLVVVRLLQVVLSAGMVNLAYLIAARAFGSRPARLAGVIVALYPAFVMYVRPIMPEGLFLPLLASLVFASYEIRREPSGVRHYAAWGAAAGIAILTRTEVVFLVAVLGLYLMGRQAFADRRVHAAGFIVAAGLIGLCLLPAVAYNYQAHGVLTFAPNKRWSFWNETWWADARKKPEWTRVVLPERRVVPHWDSLTEVQRDRYLWAAAVRFVREHPATFAVQRLSHLYRAYPLVPRELFQDPGSPDGHAFGPTSVDDVVRYVTVAERMRVWAFRIICLLAAVGVLQAWRAQMEGAVILLLVIGWNVAHTTAFVAIERVRIQADLFLAIIAAFAVTAIVAGGGALRAPTGRQPVPTRPPAQG